MPRTTQSNLKTMLAAAGALGVLAGLYAPLVRIPLGGDQNLFSIYRLQHDPSVIWVALICVVLAAAALGAAALGRYRWLWVTGFFGLSAWIVGYLRWRDALAESAAHMQAQLAGNPFAWFAQGMFDQVQLDWGAYAMLTGAALMLAAAIAHELHRGRALLSP